MNNTADYSTWPTEYPLQDNVDYPQVSHINTLRSAVNASPTENVIYNSIFRYDTHAWTLNTNASRETTVGGYLVGAASITDANASDTYVAKQVLNNASETVLKTNNVLVVSAFVKTTQGSDGVYLSVLNNDTGANIASTITYHSGDGNWHRIYSVFTVPSGSTSLGIYLVKPASATAVYANGFQLEGGTMPTGFRERIAGDGTSRIQGNDIANTPSFNGQPRLASGFQASGYWGFTESNASASSACGNTITFPLELTNSPTSLTFTTLQAPANVSGSPSLQFMTVYGVNAYILSTSTGETFYQASYVTVGN